MLATRSLFALLLAVGSALLLAAGCADGSRPGAAATQTSAAAKPTAVSTPATVSASAAIPARTVAQIRAGAASSGLLDGVHLRAGRACEDCHGPLPESGAPTVPDVEKCLSCHGGTYEALAARTAALGEGNPHDSHKGPLACALCHGVHKPFDYYCNACHTLSVPAKYRVRA